MVPKRGGGVGWGVGGSTFGSPALALHYICNNIIVLSIKKNIEFWSEELAVFWWHLSGVKQLPSPLSVSPLTLPWFPGTFCGSLLVLAKIIWYHNLSSLLHHLSDWQAPAVYRKILVCRDWTQILITGFLKIKYHIGCICLTFLHCAFSCVSSNCLPERMQKVTLVAFVWLFSTVRFHVCPQIACPRESKVTLVAFVQLFSSVCFHVSPQMAWPWGCKVTLVAFVSLFPTDDNVCCDDFSWATCVYRIAQATKETL